MIKSKVISLLLSVAFVSIAFAHVDTLWARRYTSAGAGSDYVYGLAIDNAGNVYITGSSDYLGTPSDLLTIKYNASGDTVWTRVPVRTGSQMARSVAVGNLGNVYITGYTMETGNGDYLTVKYFPNGDMAWVRTYNGPYTGYDFARKIVIDAQENVYVSGYSQEIGGRYTHATVKYDSSGNLLWARRDSFDGAGSLSYPADLGLDNSGNPYIVSKTRNASGNTDYVSAKYNSSNGDSIWVRTYDSHANGNDDARGIAFDNSGNVYVTGMIAGSGTGNDIATIKYNASGDTQWIRIYNNPDTIATDAGYWIEVDGSGNVYVYGSSYGTSGANADLVLIKYNASGTEQWVSRYNAPAGYDFPIDKDGQNGMAIDLSGNIYLSGITRQIGSTTRNDFITIKYNPAGDTQWTARYNYCDSFEIACAMDIDNSGNVYVTGRSTGLGTYYDCATIKYRQSQSIEEVNLPNILNQMIGIYPNPAKSYFAVGLPQTTGRSILKIFDVTGKQVKEIVIHNDGEKAARVSLVDVNPGIYFIKVDKGPSVQKLIITR